MSFLHDYVKTDSTIPLLAKSQISSLEPSSVGVQPGLCPTCSETGFLILATRLNMAIIHQYSLYERKM